MFDLLVNAEGGLTTAGYVVTISVGIVPVSYTHLTLPTN